MPTRDVLASFWRDWDQLTPQQQGAFREAVAQFVAGLKATGRASTRAFEVEEIDDEVFEEQLAESHAELRALGARARELEGAVD